MVAFKSKALNLRAGKEIRCENGRGEGALERLLCNCPVGEVGLKEFSAAKYISDTRCHSLCQTSSVSFKRASQQYNGNTYSTALITSQLSRGFQKKPSLLPNIYQNIYISCVRQNILRPLHSNIYFMEDVCLRQSMGNVPRSMKY
jgi:hypothetical protein